MGYLICNRPQHTPLFKMISLLCIAVLIAVAAGNSPPLPPPPPSGYAAVPPPPPPGYPAPPPGYAPRRFHGRPLPSKGPLGGGLGLDPLTFLLFQQNGGLGGNGGGDLESILPLLLLGGGGLGGGLNPLLLASLFKNCKEPYPDCSYPNEAPNVLCGIGHQTFKRCCKCPKP